MNPQIQSGIKRFNEMQNARKVDVLVIIIRGLEFFRMNEWKRFIFPYLGYFSLLCRFEKTSIEKKIQVFCNALEHEWIRTKVIPPWRELPNFWPFFKTDIGVSHCFDGFVISYCYVICFVFQISKR